VTRRIAALLLALAGVAAPGLAQNITEFEIPTANAGAVDITAGPDGNVWFTETLGGVIARITPSGTITEFLNDPSFGPAGITLGPDGNLWYTDLLNNEIGRVTPSGVVTRFPIGGMNKLPVGIAAGPDGSLWFAEFGSAPPTGTNAPSTGGQIGRMTTSGAVTQFNLPIGASPVIIRAGPDGNLWFTDPGTNTIGRMTTDGALTSFTVPTIASGPIGLTVGIDGALWFTETNTNKIGRITTSGVFAEFPVPTSVSPLGISKGPDGNLWFTDPQGNSIGRITTSGAVTPFEIPTAASGPVQICAGPDGSLWFTELSVNQIGKLTLAGGSCTADATTACLNGGRFETRQTWTTADGRSGPGMAVPLTGDTAYFWYFTSNNVESVVKVVDGCGFNSRDWVFAGGLTNVNVKTVVRDTKTGTVQTYTNPQGTAFQPIQDTSAFACATSVGGNVRAAAPESRARAAAGPDLNRLLSRLSRPARAAAPETTTACSPDTTTLCLNGGRFQVRAQWSTADGRNGAGQAVPLTSDTGYFWFFSANNVEMVIKVVSGCGFNSRYWVFAGGLTNVAVSITVTDTQTGAVQNYNNPQGTPFQPIQDTSAFVCP
jgi:virginiamycin B lyase